MGLELPIFALRARERLIEDNACSGWPTASSRDWKDTPGMSQTGINPDGSTRKRIDQLARVAHMLSPWGTPTGQQAKHATISPGEENRDPANLHLQVLSAWPTPNTMEGGQTSRSADRKGELLMGGIVRSLTGYPTPRTPTGGPESAERKQELGRTESGGGDLQAVARAFSGMMPESSSMESAKRGEYQLNPFFSLWLQGFPITWVCCAARVIQSYRKSRRNS